MTAIKDHDKTGNVTLIDPKPAVDPWPIITDEARTAWFEQQNVLRSGYPDDHGAAVGWYEEAWERVNDRPAPPWVRAITFSPSCWDGACWECEWAPEACACGHHAPWSCAPAGPVVAADPLPAVAAFLGIAKPAPEAEPEGLVHWTPEEPDQPACDADVDAPASTAMLGALNPARVTCPACQRITIDAAPEPAAGEPAPATDATAVLVDIAAEQEAVKEPGDATKVIAVTDAPTEAVPVVKDEDGGDTDA